MDERLLKKIAPIEAMAEENGWITERRFATIDGAESVQLTGIRYDGLPDGDVTEFGFSVAFCIGTHTNRVQAMRLDGKPGAVFVMVVEDGTGRYWYGPLGHHKRALQDPQEWTGVVPSDREGVSA